MADGTIIMGGTRYAGKESLGQRWIREHEERVKRHEERIRRERKLKATRPERGRFPEIQPLQPCFFAFYDTHSET